MLRVCKISLAASMAASVELRGGQRQNMQPELVAETLLKVEDKWLQQATVFAECDSSSGDCTLDTKSFQTSCETVAMSIVQGSSGDRSVVKEYMSDVCGEGALLQDWHRDRCQSFAAALASAMSIDSASNRDHFDSQSVCTGLWTEIQGNAKAQVEKDRADRAAAEKEREARAAAEAKAAEERARLEEEEHAKQAEAKRIAEEKITAQATVATNQAEKAAENDVATAAAADNAAAAQNPSVESNASQQAIEVAPETPVAAAEASTALHVSDAPTTEVPGQTVQASSTVHVSDAPTTEVPATTEEASTTEEAITALHVSDAATTEVPGATQEGSTTVHVSDAPTTQVPTVTASTTNTAGAGP